MPKVNRVFAETSWCDDDIRQEISNINQCRKRFSSCGERVKFSESLRNYILDYEDNIIEVMVSAGWSAISNLILDYESKRRKE